MLEELVIGDAEESHRLGNLRQDVAEKLLFTFLKDVVACLRRHEEAQSTTVIDDAVAGQLFISFHGCIGVHANGYGKLTHRRYPLVRTVTSCKDVIGNAVGHLEVYSLIAVECHGKKVFIGVLL